MMKRMVIMLVAVALRVRRDFRLPGFKAGMIKKFMATLMIAAADHLGDRRAGRANGSPRSRRSARCAP